MIAVDPIYVILVGCVAQWRNVIIGWRTNPVLRSACSRRMTT